MKTTTRSILIRSDYWVKRLEGDPIQPVQIYEDSDGFALRGFFGYTTTYPSIDIAFGETARRHGFTIVEFDPIEEY